MPARQDPAQPAAEPAPSVSPTSASPTSVAHYPPVVGGDSGIAAVLNPSMIPAAGSPSFPPSGISRSSPPSQRPTQTNMKAVRPAGRSGANIPAAIPASQPRAGYSASTPPNRQSGAHSFDSLDSYPPAGSVTPPTRSAPASQRQPPVSAQPPPPATNPSGPVTRPSMRVPGPAARAPSQHPGRIPRDDDPLVMAPSTRMPERLSHPPASVAPSAPPSAQPSRRPDKLDGSDGLELESDRPAKPPAKDDLELDF